MGLMEIKKAFNNNVVLMQNNEGQEMVVMDRGLAFQKKRVKQSDPTRLKRHLTVQSQRTKKCI